MSNKLKKNIKKFIPSYILYLYSNYCNHKNKQLFSKRFKLTIGKNVNISPDCLFEEGVKIYDNVTLRNVAVGKYTYFAPNSSISNAKIGRYCSIGPDVKIGLGNHPSEKIVTTHPAFFSINKQSTVIYADKNYFKEFSMVNIGNDVWIGANVIIKDGIHISDGAIVGAGAVVVKNVQPYSIVGGVPAQLIKYRFSQEEINFLKQFKWWDKSDEWLKKHWKNFLDIKKFIEKHKSKALD